MITNVPLLIPQNSAHHKTLILVYGQGCGRNVRKWVWRKQMTEEPDEVTNLQLPLCSPDPGSLAGNWFSLPGVMSPRGTHRSFLTLLPLSSVPYHSFWLLSVLLESVTTFFLVEDLFLYSQYKYFSRAGPTASGLFGMYIWPRPKHTRDFPSVPLVTGLGRGTDSIRPTAVKLKILVLSFTLSWDYISLQPPGSTRNTWECHRFHGRQRREKKKKV